MWKDKIHEHYRWAKIKTQQDEILYELFKAEDEEEAGLYLLKLHFENKAEMNFFTKKEERKIKQLLTSLMEDTAKHCGLLHEAAEKLRQKWGIGDAGKTN